MNNFYIVVNSEKENTETVRRQIEEYLAVRRKRFYSSGGSFVKGESRAACRDIPPDTECVITLGGDGTLLLTARALAGSNIPIIGINLGNLGYLTELGRDGNIEELLDALICGRYRIQERMMLKGIVYHEGRPMHENIALNDIVVSREGELQILRFGIYVNGKLLNQYSADGMIVATPTGSTAYNLSAGGPIAQPDGQLLLLTPICPHTLASRTIVFSPESRIKIEVSETNKGRPTAVFDGDTKVPLECGDFIEIERSGMVTRIIKLDNRSFLDILKQKMAQ
ncbi:MAG: NAD(+)/NADH kinase [Lachnospiraceae bacterium]|jgi:NAD+ kinase|nr:NAD(+)/NADH kinase [Lachnospiraceae bacterium]